MPQLQMEMFNRLYKAVTIGKIVNRQQCLPTHCIYSFETHPKWRSYFISPIHIFHLSYRLSFSPCCILSLSILFYRVWGNEIQRERESERERGRQSDVFTVKLRSNARLLVPVGEPVGLHLELCTYRQTCCCSHTETCTSDLSGGRRQIGARTL